MSETTEPADAADPNRRSPPTSPMVPATSEVAAAGVTVPAPLNALAPGDASTRFDGSAPFSGMPVVDGTTPALVETPAPAAPSAFAEKSTLAEEPRRLASSPIQEWLAAKPDLATGLGPPAVGNPAAGPCAGVEDDGVVGSGLASSGPASAPEQPPFESPPPLASADWLEAVAGRPVDSSAPPLDPEPVPLSGHELPSPPEPPTVRDELADLAPERAAGPLPLAMPGQEEAANLMPDPVPAGDEPLVVDADVPPSPDVPPAVEPELAVAAGSVSVADGGTSSGPAEPVPVGPVMTMASEPTPIELASIPPEPDGAVPVAALAPVAGTGGAAPVTANAADAATLDAASAVAAPAADHRQTATTVFAHAREDAEYRRGVLSHGLLTKTAGVAGLLACVVGLAVMLLACAGLVPARSANLLAVNEYAMWTAVGVGGLALLLVAGSFRWKSWWQTAIGAVVVAVALGGVWFAVGRYHARIDGFNPLIVSPYIVYAAAGGLALALLGGLVEHRRMREETHVLAALFTNAIAAVGGALLWVVQVGWKII